MATWRRSEVRRRLTALAVSALIALVAACGGSSDLEALRNEEIAGLTLPAASEPRRVEQASGETLGKPNQAVLQLRFIPVQGATLEQVLAEAVAGASDLGWALEQESESFYRGTKTTDGGATVTLEVYIAPEVQEVIVQLIRR